MNGFPQNIGSGLEIKYNIEKIFIKGDKGYDWDQPYRLAVSNEGNVFVLDMQNNRILVYDGDMQFIKSIGSDGDQPGNFKAPIDIEIGFNNLLYVLELENSRIQVFNTSGDFVRLIKVPIRTLSFTLDEDDNIYINSPNPNGPLIKFDKNGNQLFSFGNLLEKDRQKYGYNWAFLEYDQSSKKIIASYQFLPIIQIYDRDGILRKEFELDSKNVQELKHKEIPDCISHKELFHLTYSIGITVQNGICYNVICHASPELAATLYIFNIAGEKINEVPLVLNGGQSIDYLMSIYSKGDNFFLTTADGKILKIKWR